MIGLVCFALMLALAVGGTLAYYVVRSDGANNRFVTGVKGCVVNESVADNQKTSIEIQNTGNFPAYVRVRLLTYWVNEEEQPVGKTAAKLMPTLASGWVQYGNVYYYTKPLQGGASVEFLGANLAMTEEEGCRQVIEVLAESIQSAPPEAIKDAWGRSVDADGNVIG